MSVPTQRVSPGFLSGIIVRHATRRYRPRPTTPVVVALLAFLLSLSACDDTVNPIVESDQQITLFATLDMLEDVQWVRFIPVRGTIGSSSVNPEDFGLVSTDLTTGQQLVWEDSLVTFDNGAVGLFFYADLRVQPGHSYSFEATKAGSSVVTTAMTTVPEMPIITVLPEEVTQFVGSSGFVVNGFQSVSWSGLNAEPFDVDIFYRFLRTRNDPFRDIELEPKPLITYADGNLSFTLNLPGDRFLLQDSLDLAKHALMGIGMEITTLDDNFVPPGGVFDPELLVQPGTFSNVTNGFGYIGAVGRYRAEWTLTDASMRILRYQTPADLFGKRDFFKSDTETDSSVGVY